ncbi:MAG: hypothetical protein LBU07_05150 [Coriobacteriales bacterium]|jgi:hypothetical protein|nr:hypothetical protein [Coriobacteriales bacterium]
MGKREKMVQYVIDACNDASVGYSQVRRWRDPDVDCSSLMYLAAHAAGYAIPRAIGSGYTGTMRQDFEAAGFVWYPFNGQVNDSDPGEIYLNTQNHTEMYVGNGKFGGAHIDENGGVTGARGGDQTGNEVSMVNAYIYSRGWDGVLVPPDSGGESSVPSAPAKTIDTLAKEVIGGLWGTGAERRQRLIDAGYDYEAVQRRVNEIIAGSNESAGNVTPAPDIDSIAWAVIRGEYGNGQSRIDALVSAGYDASAVQASVNELLS